MLGSANSEISLRAAAINARNTQLTVQLEGLGARLSGAEQQIQDREAALAAARTAMLEKDSGLRQLEGQVAALRQQLVDCHQGARKQDDRIRCSGACRGDQGPARLWQAHVVHTSLSVLRQHLAARWCWPGIQPVLRQTAARFG